jgi:hypothetical protein
MMAVNVPQCLQKIDAIYSIKGAVDKWEEAVQILLLCIQNKIMWPAGHPRQEFGGILDDGGFLSPGQGGSQKGCNLNIGILAKLMGHLYGIGPYKVPGVIELGFFVQER